MYINIITIFPEMFSKIFDFGIINQAIKKHLVKIDIHNLRDFAINDYGQVDDNAYGGVPGMVLRIEPLVKALNKIKSDNKNYKVINLSPKGQKLTQKLCEDLKDENLIVVCGRYEGIDQRFIDNYVDLEVSIGDYVLSGGEIPAMVLVDSIVRLIPGSIKNSNFNKNESFSNESDRKKLDYPVYTRPADYKGMKVPEILLSGHHKKVEDYNKNQTN